MSRKRRPGAPYGSAAWRARIGAGVCRAQEVQREPERVLPRDLAAAWRSAAVRPALRAWVEDAADALAAWINALGGEHRVTPQRWALLQSAARLGVVESELSLAFMQNPDPELASRIATVAGQRARLLERVGLDRAEREVPALQEYLRQREREKAEDAAQAATSAPNGAAPAYRRPPRPARAAHRCPMRARRTLPTERARSTSREARDAPAPGPRPAPPGARHRARGGGGPGVCRGPRDRLAARRGEAEG